MYIYIYICIVVVVVVVVVLVVVVVVVVVFDCNFASYNFKQPLNLRTTLNFSPLARCVYIYIYSCIYLFKHQGLFFFLKV